MKKQAGLVYVFYGDGKGKTSAALGVATRMLCIGRKVIWVSWYKSDDWPISEKRLIERFPDNLEMHWTGKGFYFGGSRVIDKKGTVIFDTNTPDGHKLAAESALNFCKSLFDKKYTGGGMTPDLLVMDEVIRAVTDGLLKEEDVLRLIRNRGETNLVLTGHTCPESIIKSASLVTEMRKVKHPYDVGVLAVRGLDY